MNNHDQFSIFLDFPVIELDNIILRKIDLDNDHSNYLQYLTMPQVAKYLAESDVPKDLVSARSELNYWSRLFDLKLGFYWGIALKDSNEFIGTCGFNYWNRDHKRAEISYDLDYNYWGQGIMTKCINAISNFGLQTMKVQRIQATVAIDNIPSIRVLEKTGYKRESLLKKFGILQSESKDFYMYTKFE